jgi:hypothetical protein
MSLHSNRILASPVRLLCPVQLQCCCQSPKLNAHAAVNALLQHTRAISTFCCYADSYATMQTPAVDDASIALIYTSVSNFG